MGVADADTRYPDVYARPQNAKQSLHQSGQMINSVLPSSNFPLGMNLTLVAYEIQETYMEQKQRGSVVNMRRTMEMPEHAAIIGVLA